MKDNVINIFTDCRWIFAMTYGAAQRRSACFCVCVCVISNIYGLSQANCVEVGLGLTDVIILVLCLSEAR